MAGLGDRRVKQRVGPDPGGTVSVAVAVKSKYFNLDLVWGLVG